MSVCTSNAEFSDIAFDHKHEQMNKEIKSTCGYINLVYKEDHDFLRKLEVCCPEINQFLSEIGTDDVRYQNTENKLPHSCKSLFKTVKVASKPLFHNSTSLFQKLIMPIYVYPQIITEDSGNLFVIGEEQYEDIVETRFVILSLDVVKGVISRNSLKLPKDSNSIVEASPKIQ